MTVLDWLVIAVCLYFLNICVQAVFGNMRYDPKTLLGPRDDFTPEGVGLLRARRAQANFTEAMIMFAPLALVAGATGSGGGIAAIGGAVFVISRAVYLVVYVAGVAVVRSLAWMVGVLGTAMVFWAVAPFR
ncbi:MAG: MAPEG family protein [Pseudomonadota bacterium]